MKFVYTYYPNTLDIHTYIYIYIGDVYIKIDRPTGIITFGAPKSINTTLTHWSSDIHNLLSIMDKTCHLIARENMVYKLHTTNAGNTV